MSVKIFEIEKRSVCYKKGIRAGDTLISVNGNPITDVLDYRFYCNDDRAVLVFQTSGGKTKTVKIKYVSSPDDLGLCFETYLMDKKKSCKNKCIFCFIDQLPKGLRPSLYFKDDDARLSFLFGNYITLTNLTEADVDRIIKMHISPINASVHTMDPALRVKMMKNPNAGEVLNYLYRFSEAGIRLNVQLVLCPGINDGAALEYTLQKLLELNSLQSVAAVPVGLTRYRNDLYPLRKFSKEEAARVIDTIDRFNKKLSIADCEQLAYPSDEFFQLAGRELPDYDYYGDFPQLENGVGMLTSLRCEFLDALRDAPADNVPRSLGIVTGYAAYDLMNELVSAFRAKFSQADITVYGIKNVFFGEDVTVAGLLTGTDIINHFKEHPPAQETLLFPSVMLKSSSEPVFLDDVSIRDVEQALQINAVVADCDARSLFRAICGAV